MIDSSQFLLLEILFSILVVSLSSTLDICALILLEFLLEHNFSSHTNLVAFLFFGFR